MFENGRTDLYHKFLVLSSAHVWAIYQISNIYFESFLGYGDQNKLFCYSFSPHFLWDHFNIQVTHLPNFKYLTAWRFRLADPNQTAKFENSRFYRSDLVDMKLYWLMKELQASKDSCVHFVFMLTWTPNLKSLSSYQEFTNEYMFLIILRLKIHIILLTKILLRIHNIPCFELPRKIWSVMNHIITGQPFDSRSGLVVFQIFCGYFRRWTNQSPYIFFNAHLLNLILPQK